VINSKRKNSDVLNQRPKKMPLQPSMVPPKAGSAFTGRKLGGMQLILLGRNRAVARCVDITATRIWLAGALLAAGLALVISIGADATTVPQSAADQRAFEDLQAELASQNDALADIRQSSDEQIGALAVRMAQLNASVIRLNALGQRLTGMADLDDGEFDFEDFPAVGGPVLSVNGEQDPMTGRVPELLTDFKQLAATIDSQEQQLQALEALLLNRKLHERVLPSGRPVNSGWISSFFGRRSDPMTGKQSMHKGIDFAGKYGAEVVAVSDGVVVSSRKRSGFGNTVEIRHGDGYMTRYAHNQENLVTVGEQVIQGQTIAYLGSTGRSTGPHVHFEVWQNGRPVDPSRYIQ
jgi:murein DD-endopeptidase MepM/ murein hydrolase activator NlpD